MAPRTRPSNQDAQFKVYYSKKVPGQMHFPHRRKVVRAPQVRDEGDKRQMRFLPEMMREKREVADSDEEEEEEEEDVEGLLMGSEGESGDAHDGKIADGRSKKRRSETLEADPENENDVARPVSKRRQKAGQSRPNRESKKIKSETEEEQHHDVPAQARRSKKGETTLRRQTTMTQLAEGRPLLSDDEEPTFKRIPRRPRLSWGGKGKNANDTKQRTLTQMVPGREAVGIVSDEDVEEALSDADEQGGCDRYSNAIATRLAREGLFKGNGDCVDGEPQEGLFKNNSDHVDHIPREGQKQHKLSLQKTSQEDDVHMDLLTRPIHSFGDDGNEVEGESYQPTQFIDALAPSTRRTRRQHAVTNSPVLHTPLSAMQRTEKSTFSNLSTPEKRRTRVIPSSQSPPDTPLSTQVSPSKIHRTPLGKRYGNTVQGAETSSRRKQVTFQEPSKEDIPPPSLKKFKSVIQDSEDEDEELLDLDENGSQHDIATRTQHLHGGTVGDETQAIIDRIDQACADADDDISSPDRENQEELHELIISRSSNQSSPELGEQIQQQSHSYEISLDMPIKEEPPHSIDSIDLSTIQPTLGEGFMSAKPEPANSDIDLPIAQEQVPSSPPMMEAPVEETCPSTPMVIMDSSDEEEDMEPTPPHQGMYTTDLDGQPIQVPRSPAVPRETQQSHSSKAEQQLQSEWFSYSQYVNTGPPQSSSMHVAHDKFSYGATPKPPRFATQQQSVYPTSQATTIDEVTPRKNRIQRFPISANTTPHKIASSQPFTSPSKPPPLFIPSSFPSPAKTRMEDWSSGMLEETQDLFGESRYGASLEDFSIPLPPPSEQE
ncbi:hypothetical protein GQ44DRAFT_415406 [Phaeosphaeriaceae sp. PMI808]|nr:hypothetical protein GQ44DRAFT_415406 [Phaeosphaeriaceae sp. PMI808]